MNCYGLLMLAGLMALVNQWAVHVFIRNRIFDDR